MKPGTNHTGPAFDIIFRNHETVEQMLASGDYDPVRCGWTTEQGTLRQAARMEQCLLNDEGVLLIDFDSWSRKGMGADERTTS